MIKIMIVISVPFVGTPYFQQNTLKTSGAVLNVVNPLMKKVTTFLMAISINEIA